MSQETVREKLNTITAGETTAPFDLVEIPRLDDGSLDFGNRIFGPSPHDQEVFNSLTSPTKEINKKPDQEIQPVFPNRKLIIAYKLAAIAVVGTAAILGVSEIKDANSAETKDDSHRIRVEQPLDDFFSLKTLKPEIDKQTPQEATSQLQSQDVDDAEKIEMLFGDTITLTINRKDGAKGANFNTLDWELAKEVENKIPGLEI